MKLLIGYLILINAAGFLSMFLDKVRARQNRYRISERQLFLIAAAGGCAGSLAGMCLFRHKTRHKRFFIGLPVILFLQIVVLMIAASSFHAQAGRPSAAVRQTLDLIQEMDEDTIQSFVTYKALSDQQITPDNEDTALDAVRLFFEHFHYEITDEQIDGDTASVAVNITNLDAHALAHDLCLQLTSHRINIADPSETLPAADNYFRLLRDTLQEGHYPLVRTPAVFQLTLEKHKWILKMDSESRDQLMGGLSAWLRNPYILTPEEILKLYMDAFASLDADGWIRYLSANDLFATESARYASEADQLYFEKIADCFDWEPGSCVVTGDRAAYPVTITSLNLKEILLSYRAKLLEFAGTTEAITGTPQELADTSAQLLIASIEEAAAPQTYSVSVEFFNDGVTWQPADVAPLINAFLGDLENAMEVMR